MYFFIERMNNAKNSVINNEETNAFDEIYQNTMIEFYNKYELPPLHEYGDGFTKGDASNEECDTLVAKGLAAKEDEGSYTFAELDKLFCDAIEIAVEKYNDNYLEENWKEYYEDSIRDFLSENYFKTGCVINVDYSIYIDIKTGKISEIREPSSNWSFSSHNEFRRLIVHLNNYDISFRDISYFIAENSVSVLEMSLNIDLPENFSEYSSEEKLEWFENNEPSLVDDFNMTAREDIIDYIIDNIE